MSIVNSAGLKKIALAFAFVAAIFVWIAPDTLSVSSAAAQQQAPAAAEQTVDQTRKNIQVLKGLPDAQLLPLMNLVSASLGVNCAFCHVRAGNEWQYEKDDKKAKQDARKMMKMTLDINKASFEGKTEVTCYTCHQGKDHPVGVPPLPRVVASGEGPRRPAPPAVTVQQVLEKYVQAVGGKEAVAKIKTRALKGTHETANGMSFPLELRFASPDRLSLTATTPRQGVVSQGLNGSAGWLKNDRGQRSLDSVELSRIKAVAWSLELLAVKEPYPRLTYGGREKVGELETHVLRMVTPDRKRVRLCFDVETGLLLRRVVVTDTIFGPDPEQTDFEDYREVDGVKVPFTIRTSYLDNNFSATRKFTEIKHNVPVEDAQFNPPATK